MNYLSTSTFRASYSFITRVVIVLLLFFFIGFLAMETFSFIRLFEVTVVANPAINLIK
jgi:hypothetical protein